MSVKHNWQLSFREARRQANKYIQEKMLIAQCLFQMKSPVVTKLSRTSNFIGSCWHEALLF